MIEAKVLESLKGEEKLERKAVLQHYRRVLEGGLKSPSELASLRGLMTELGKSAADVEEDVKTLSLARSLESKVAEGPRLEKEYADASSAMMKDNEATEAFIKAAEARHMSLFAHMESLGHRQGEARNAVFRLQELKIQHAELLAD